MHRRVGFVVAMSVVLLSACNKEGDASSRSPAVPVDEADTDQSSGASGVAGQLVIQLTPKEGAGPETVAGAQLSAVDHPEITAVADANGLIKSEAVLPGVVSLLVTSDNAPGLVAAGAAQYGLKLDDVVIKAGETNDLGSQAMLAAGSVKGKVGFYQGDTDLDASGSDVYIPGTGFVAKTGESGVFEIGGLPPGKYPLYAQREGFAILKLPSITVAEGEATDLGTLMLSLSDGPEGGISVKPTLTKTISGESAKIVTTRAVTFALSYDSDASLMKISDEPSFLNRAWEPVKKQASWTFAADGHYKIYVMFSDLNGLESSPYADSVYVDTEAPTLSSAKILYNWSHTAGQTNFVDFIGADSGAGIAEVMVSVGDPAFTGATWRTYASRLDVDVGAATGLKDLYFKVRDFAGNVSAAASDSITKTTYTTVPTIVSHDVILFRNQSPFKLAGETTVTGTLKIEAGTTVEFDRNYDGSSEYGSQLIVDGPLLIQGTPAQRVRFVADPASTMCRHEIDLRAQTNDDISASQIDYLTLEDLCMLRLKGGSIKHLLVDGAPTLFNGNYSAVITKSGTEPLSITDAVGSDFQGAAFLRVEANGGTVQVRNANLQTFTGSQVAPFYTSTGSTLVVEDSVIDGSDYFIRATSGGSGEVTVRRSTITAVATFASEVVGFLAERNDMTVQRLHFGFSGADNNATYRRNRITLVGTGTGSGQAELAFFAGGRNHVVALTNNNITCRNADYCRGAIRADNGMAPASVHLTMTDNHWTDRTPFPGASLVSCTGGFVACLDGGNGDSAYDDRSYVGIYEYRAAYTGTPTPDALWSASGLGVDGNYTVNAAANSPVGKP